jgi:hypothetical protein
LSKLASIKQKGWNKAANKNKKAMKKAILHDKLVGEAQKYKGVGKFMDSRTRYTDIPDHASREYFESVASKSRKRSAAEMYSIVAHCFHQWLTTVQMRRANTLSSTFSDDKPRSGQGLAPIGDSDDEQQPRPVHADALLNKSANAMRRKEDIGESDDEEPRPVHADALLNKSANAMRSEYGIEESDDEEPRPVHSDPFLNKSANAMRREYGIGESVDEEPRQVLTDPFLNKSAKAMRREYSIKESDDEEPRPVHTDPFLNKSANAPRKEHGK